MSERLRFQRNMRIGTRYDFRRIFKRRCSVANGALVLYVDDATTDGPRLGVRAGKRLGNAVARNRARRRVKEAFRLEQHALPKLDMVVILRDTQTSVADYRRGLIALAQSGQRKLKRDRG